LTARGRLAHDLAVARPGQRCVVLDLLLGVGMGVAPVGCTVPTEGFVDPRGELLVEWVFDDVGASTIVDRAGPPEDLELAGGEWVRDDGPVHVRFDGIDDLGQGPDVQAWIPTLGSVTLEAKVRIDPQPSDWSRRPIVGLPQSSATGDFPLALQVFTAAHRLELSLVAGDVHVQVNDDAAYEPGQWITIHGVYDGAQASLYVDGQPAADPRPASGLLDGYQFSESRQRLMVAGTGRDGEQLACGLASLRIYGRALVPDEVAYRHQQLDHEDTR
jgi:hypothetical protein